MVMNMPLRKKINKKILYAKEKCIYENGKCIDKETDIDKNYDKTERY